MTIEQINISRFCDLQGVDDFNRTLLEKRFGKLLKTYTEWYNTCKEQGFVLTALKKEFLIIEAVKK
jgi:hypothetical protein